MSQYHYYESVLRTLIWLQFSRAIMGTNGLNFRKTATLGTDFDWTVFRSWKPLTWWRCSPVNYP